MTPHVANSNYEYAGWRYSIRIDEQGDPQAELNRGENRNGGKARHLQSALQCWLSDDCPRDDLRRGQLVSVLTPDLEGREHWVAARVRRLSPTRASVEALADRPFQRSALTVVHLADRGHRWRSLEG